MSRYPMRLQVIVTQRCNAVCDYCDKAVGVVKLSDMEMTAAMMEEAVDQCVAADMKVRRVTLSGGEPILNVELQGIIDACLGLPEVEKIRVLTNDMTVSKPARDRIVLPDERFHWVPAPLDDVDDPYSGKNNPVNDRVRNRVHHPFFISPADIGIKASFTQCRVAWRCGRGLDSSGFSMCGQAGVLGRILGIDPYPKGDVDIKKHVLSPIDEICRHCPYGMKKNAAKQFARDTLSGKIPSGMSPTYEAAVERFNSGPITYDIAFDRAEIDATPR